MDLKKSPGSYTKDRIPRIGDQGSYTKDRIPRIEYQGSNTKDRIPRIVYQGSDTKDRIFTLQLCPILMQFSFKQCFGSGSVSFGRIRIRIRKPLIWIRVATKINQNHRINKSKWFVNVLFTFYMTKIFQNYL